MNMDREPLIANKHDLGGDECKSGDLALSFSSDPEHKVPNATETLPAGAMTPSYAVLSASHSATRPRCPLPVAPAHSCAAPHRPTSPPPLPTPPPPPPTRTHAPLH